MMTTASATTRQLLIRSTATTFESISSFTKLPPPTFLSLLTKRKINRNSIIIPQVSSNKTNNNNNHMKETIFFDGGAHYGDLVANLLLGFTLVWLPLTLAAVLRGFFLRYRFTNLRVTVISGLTGQDRSDFSYKVIKDVQVVPRFIGEWGDVIITLKDGTKIDLRSVPKFREIANYCLSAITTKSSTDDDDQLLKLEQAKGF